VLQSLALGLGYLLLRTIAAELGVPERQAHRLGLLYFVYPPVIGANLFDFHPDVLAVPLLLWALLLYLRRRPWAYLGAVALAVALGAGPLYWSWATLGHPANGSSPVPGPQAPGRDFGPGFGGFGGDGQVTVNTALLRLLLAHYRPGQYLFATLNATEAAPYIIRTGLPVMAMGGFLGSDPAIYPSQLARLVAQGRLHFFLLPGGGLLPRGGDLPLAGVGRGGFFGGGSVEAENVAWVQAHCTAVPPSAWGGSTGGPAAGFGGFFGGAAGGQALYECGTGS